MKLRKLFASSLALAAVLGTVALSNPADAQGLQGIFNNLTGRGGMGFNANNSAAFSALNNTAVTLDGMINSGMSTGRIHPAQANDFRAQLAQITQLQAGYMADGNLNASETQNLYNQFANLTAQVNNASNGGGFTPYGTQYNPNFQSGLYNPWF